MDCCIVNRDTLLEIIDHYQGADYLDLLEALQGDLGNIDVCSYEYKGEVVGVFSEKSLYRRSMDLLDQTVADQLFDPCLLYTSQSKIKATLGAAVWDINKPFDVKW